MSIISKIERIQQMHKMISFKRTGTPSRFAEQLGVSQSMLYVLIKEIKALGAPVVYCRHRESYEYLYPVEFNAGFRSPARSPINYALLADDNPKSEHLS